MGEEGTAALGDGQDDEPTTESHSTGERAFPQGKQAVLSLASRLGRLRRLTN